MWFMVVPVRRGAIMLRKIWTTEVSSKMIYDFTHKDIDYPNYQNHIITSSSPLPKDDR